jgi:hypothetical protein
MHVIRFILAILLIVIFIPQLAHSQVKSATMNELTTAADMIIIGKVQEMNSEWNDQKTRIYTRVTLSVDECMKGDPSVQSIELRQPGGEIGEIGEFYSHTAKFAEEEEVLLFVEKDKQNKLHICHGINGKFSIKLNQLTKQVMINNRPIDTVRQEIQKIVKVEDN